MIAFDTDVLTLLLRGNIPYLGLARRIEHEDQAIPITVAEEMVRGRLSTIRAAEAGKGRISLDRAYLLFGETFDDLRQLPLLSFTPEADQIVRNWKQLKIKVATYDMRIAATCIVHGATLVTRNRRDFNKIPDLMVAYWGVEV